MKPFRLTLAVPAVLIFLGVSLRCTGVGRVAQAPVDSLAPFIEAELKQAAIPGFAIALVDEHGVRASQCFGGESGDGSVRAGAQSVWRVGSVSKMFTDLAVMQLVESGKLALDLPVTNYLPDFQPKNPFGTPITLRQLMSHRAGLVREPPIGSYFDATSPTLAATVASLNDTTLVHAPGTKMKYSNAGIAVVGRVVEVVTGEDFAKVVRERVLVPMELERSFFEAAPELAAHRVAAQMWTYWGTTFPAPTFELGMAPAGSLYAPIDDLATAMVRFLDMSRDAGGTHGVVSRASLEEMWRPQFVAADVKSGYGLGFTVGDWKKHRCIGHDGAIYGFSTILKLLPDDHLGVVAVASLDVAHGTVGKIVDVALEALLAEKEGQEFAPPATTRPLPDGLARKVAGTYSTADGKSRAELCEQRGELWLQAGPARSRVRAAASGGIVVDDRIDVGRLVELPEPGTSLKLGDKTYTRLDDTRPPPPPPEWLELLGEYGFDHNVLFVFEKAGRLHVLIEWFFDYTLAHDGGETWSFPDSGLYFDEKIVFHHKDKGDPNSPVTEAIVAGVRFPRREVGTPEGVTFQIQPLKPIEQLRSEALAASPPAEIASLEGKRAPQLVELVKVDPSLHLDIRYATKNNFMGTVFYEAPRAFLQKPAAEALKRAHDKLKAAGLGLLIHDGYRPWFVTKMFWEGTPTDHHDMVADPSKGSRHNRGCAVDLTLCDPATGRPLRMPSGYDEFSGRANPWYFGGTSEQRWLRDTLRRAMESEGFTVYENEWWHFDYGEWREYPVLNRRFAELGEPAVGQGGGP